MLKKCNMCHIDKDIQCFSKNRTTRCGRCKECKKTVRESFKNDLDKIKNIPKSKICRDCKIEKPINQFKRECGNADLHNNACKDCKSIQEYRRKHSCPESFIVTLLATAKKSAKTRDRKNDESNVCTITHDEVKNIYRRQKGMCFYSGIQMSINKKKWQMSLERLDQSKGYIVDNCVLCCLEFNGAVQWSHEKIKSMFDYLKNGDETVDFFKFDIAEHQKYKIPGVNKYYSPRVHMQKFLTNSASKSVKRNTNKPRIGEFELDFDFLVDLYHKQNGRCAYSNMPLKFRTGLDTTYHWKASLERKDPFKGYTKDNVCLICHEFNTTDNALKFKIKDKDDSSGWSAEKFQEFLNHAQNNVE